jgi:hypothetical protein
VTSRPLPLAASSHIVFGGMKKVVVVVLPPSPKMSPRRALVL